MGTLVDEQVNLRSDILECFLCLIFVGEGVSLLTDQTLEQFFKDLRGGELEISIDFLNGLHVFTY